jgi:uncharacterized protein (TIGR00369 family)
VLRHRNPRVSKATELRDRVPFAKDLGIELLSAEDGESRLQIAVTPRLLNSHGFVHGGVIMTLLDIAMAVAARTAKGGTASLVTVEMKASFLQSASAASRLIGSGVCVYRSSTMAFCEASVHDECERLISRAMGTFKYTRTE